MRPLIIQIFSYPNYKGDCSIRVFCLKCVFYLSICTGLYINEWDSIIRTFQLSEHPQGPMSSDSIDLAYSEDRLNADALE